MTATITADNRFERRGADTLECPNCGSMARMTVTAFPPFNHLRSERPAQIGVVLQCSACRSPVFMRYRTRAWRDDQVELQPLTPETDTPTDRFTLGYLPGPVASRFREALACYNHGLWQAFAAMCRLTSRAVLDDVGEPGRLRLYDQVCEVQQLADIDGDTFEIVRGIIFDPPSDRVEPDFDRRHAPVLLETMKDLLTQTYVRQAKLRQALKVRRFFAEQAESAPAPASRNVSGF